MAGDDISLSGSERSASATSDFYNLDHTEKSQVSPLHADKQPSSQPPRMPVYHGLTVVDPIRPISAGPRNDDDAASDCSSSAMDISSPSRSPTPEPEPARAAHAMLQTSLTKRKADDFVDVADMSDDAVGDHAKKRKLLPRSPPGSGTDQANIILPEQWQHIFTFLSPFDLVSVLRTCRKFNHLLCGIKVPSASKKSQDKPRMMDSDTVWARARKLHFPLLPRTLNQYGELQMLQLIGNKSCHICKSSFASAATHAGTAFNAGPGASGVRVIWQFGVRLCGKCFLKNTLTDIEILQSKASSLRAGLPWAFRTADAHYVLDLVRQLPGGIPSHLHVNKVYYSRDVTAIVRDWEEVKEFGDGAAEEWRKGLPLKGKERMTDASRWERWESNLRPGLSLLDALREYHSASSPRSSKASDRIAPKVEGSTLPVPTNGMHPLPRPVFSRHDFNTSAPLQLTVPATLPVQRPVRNLVEVEQARQARRADIEQRCLQLEPPLRSEVLQHIEAFQAAMQITTPMTDKQWDLLRPRILARREAAELFVHQKAEQYAALQSVIPSTAYDDASLKAAREVYEHAQKPLRQRLGEYADDIVIGQWHGGQGLHQHNAPGFAIQTLQHVYKRYTEDKHAGRLELDSAPKAPVSAQSTPLIDPFLSLDNMKWVYENKVKPLTDEHCRDLFICAGCRGLEKTSKWFAFEGLIQHYGAKHTSAFSQGNIVVHWETAAWPGEPGETPFSTDQAAFIKIDRKSAGSKSHSYAHRTQQPVNDDQAQRLNHHPHDLGQEPNSPGRSPTSGTPIQYYPEIGRNGHHQHANGRISQNDHLPPVPQSLDTPSEDNQDLLEQDLFADVASAFWDRLGDVENLMPCVRVQTAIHHAVENHYDRHGLRVRTGRPFNLEILINALHTNPKMVPIKEAQGLACKMCVAAQTNGAVSSQSYYVRTRDVKLYSFSSLVTHFKLHHLKEGYAMFDWSLHMIELPENPLVADLVRAPGMNDTKLGLIAMAFPTAFAKKLPKIGQIPYATTDNAKVPSLASRVLNVTKKKKRHQTVSRLEAAGSAPAEDEYDPRRPSIITRQERTLDPARFDTDLARKSTPPPGPTAEFQLPTETVAKIRHLNMMVPQVSRDHSPQPSLESRSPSVGLAASPALASPDKQVDLAAILAKLTANMAKAPVASAPFLSEKQSRSPVSTSPDRRMHPPISTYSMAQLPRQPVEIRQNAWVPSYGAEPARSESLELYAAMTHNVRQYGVNQQIHESADNSAYLAPTLRYPSPFRHSPRHDAANFHRTPVEDIPVPTSRLQHVVPPQHQYVNPGDGGLMTDQYGRQFYHALIPVDEIAPRPTSYLVSTHDPMQPVPQYVAEQAYQEPQLIYRELPAPSQHSQLPDPRSVSRGPSLGSWR